MVIIHQFYEPFLCKKTTFFVLYPILRFFLQKIIVSAWYITQKRFLSILPGADEKNRASPAKKGGPVFQYAENGRNSYKSYKPDAPGLFGHAHDARPAGGKLAGTKENPELFQMEKLGVSGGRGWIRTTEALSSRFTVCPHWPLGNTPLFCLADRLALPDDLFILPQALRFVNSFFEIFQARPMRCPALSGCLCPCGAAGCAGLLAYSSTRREICQQPILLLLRDWYLLTKFLNPLVFFQAVLYNNDSGTRRGAAVLGFCLPRSGQTREGGILQTMDIIGQFTSLFSNFGNLTWQMLVMWIVGGLLIYLAIAKKMEPSLLLPMGFGAILVNLPLSGAITQGDTEGPLSVLFQAGMSNELFPLLLFIGIGAMIDFGPLLEKPWLMLFGAAAQFGIFFTVCLAGIFFDLNDAVSIGIIGAADGPTAIFVANTLGSQYLGAIMVAAYSYMALVPIVQPPVIRAITTKKERRIRMSYQKGSVTRTTRILFPIVVTVVAGLVAPASVALVGFLMFGNLLRECGVLNSLSETAQNALANLITILLGMTVASQMTADKFVRPDTILILALGLFAFVFDTAGGVLFAKVLNLFLPEGKKINPMIGAAGISAFPMSGRVVNQMGLAEDNQNFLLMYSISVNVSGQIASVIAGGLLLTLMGA